MKIEEITKDALAKAEDGELNSLRFRMNQIYVRHFKNNDRESWQGLSRDGLIKKYASLFAEAERRGIKYKAVWSLDRIVSPATILKRKLWGIELNNVTDIELISGYVSLMGKFLESPLGAERIEVALFNEDFESKVRSAISGLIEKETGKHPDFTWPDGPTAEALTHIPLFDLVLKVRQEIKKVPGRPAAQMAGVVREATKCEFCKADAKWAYLVEGEKYFKAVCHKHRTEARKFITKDMKKKVSKVIQIAKLKAELDKFLTDWPDEELIVEIEKAEEFEISKPFPNEHSARLQSPEKYDQFRRTKGGKLYGNRISVPSNVSIIWGHPKGKPPRIWVPQSLRFPKDSYTVAEAKKWLSDNKIKYSGFEAATGKSEIFFKIEKIDAPEYIVGGIVYEANAEDTQGDMATGKEIWKALKKYMIEKREVKVMHRGRARNLPIVENYFSEDDHKKGSGVLKKGTWWLSVYLGNTKDIWEEVEKGTLTGFSMGGTAIEAKGTE